MAAARSPREGSAKARRSSSIAASDPATTKRARNPAAIRRIRFTPYSSKSATARSSMRVCAAARPSGSTTAARRIASRSSIRICGYSSMPSGRSSAGEELTYDYRLVFHGRLSKRALKGMACRCGAPRCRGTMLDLRDSKKPAGDHKIVPAAGKSTGQSSPVGWRQADGTWLHVRSSYSMVLQR